MGRSTQARRSLVAGATAWWRADAGITKEADPSTLVVTMADQTSAARNITQATSGLRPSLTSMPAVQFDGVDNVLAGTTLTNFVTAAAHTIMVAFKPLAWSTTAALSAAHANHCIIGDTSAYCGLSMRNVAGSEIMCWLEDGSYRGVTLAASLNTPIVVTHRHSGGTIYASINGGTEVSTAAGSIGGLGGTLRVGIGSTVGVHANIDLYEAVTYNTSLSADQIAQNVGTMRRRWGF